MLTFLLGVRDYVTTEISTSKQKKFNLVMFVDTPGLVDGDMLYPFEVNKAIEWLGTYFYRSSSRLKRELTSLRFYSFPFVMK